MNYSKVIRYNQAQANTLGWEPDWFIDGHRHFDVELCDAIQAWQRALGIAADGMCGPSSYRRKYAERMIDIDEVRDEVPCKPQSFLIYGGEPLLINWPKVVLWMEPGGLKTAEGHYSNRIGKPKREIKMVVNHWDVCLNSRSCSRVLNKPGRSASIHLMVDNDGTVYQSCDLQNITWHAGGSRWNACSVGIELSNGFYTKYQSWYVRNGHGERPLVRGSVNGRQLREHLDFYDVQKEAARAIWECMHNAFGLPYQAPPVDGLYKPAQDCQFEGYVHHYNLSSSKIDCGGWNIREELEKLK